MDRCRSCEASLLPGAIWCGQCFAPVEVTRPAVGAYPGGVGLLTAPVPAPVMIRSRWRKTPTTFGPLGRLSATLALVVPLAFMVVGGLADPFVWGGAGFWVLVVMPLALRDVWKAGQLRVR